MASFLSTLFGGGAEKDAANKNNALLQAYSGIGNTILDQGIARSEGAVNSGTGKANDLLGQNTGIYNQYGATANGALDTGLASATGALGDAKAAYQPLSDLATKYGAGTDMYLNSLGLNGEAGNATATGAFQAGPGYGFQMDQGLQALERKRAAAGMLGSGNADVDAITFGQGLANQNYTNWQNQLSGINNNNLTATTAAATGNAGIDTNLANLYSTDAANRAGVASNVASGLAGVNTAQAANDVALGNTLATLGSQNTSDRLGILGNVTSGGISSNNNVAAGEAKGAGNLLSAGMSLASLAAGGFGGGSIGGLGASTGASGALTQALGQGTGMATNTFGFNPLANAFKFGS